VLLFLVFCCSLLFFIPLTWAQDLVELDHAYLADLLRRSAAADLANTRYWRLLLHYRANLLQDGYTSEIDDPQFFLSPHGKTDPQAELTATLTLFLSSAPGERFAQPLQCAYIARYHWLKSVLLIDDHHLPPPQCAAFAQWFAALNPQSITLIFPSTYMYNPASMFGHTLLRIDQPGQTDDTRLLAYTINYAAHYTTKNQLAYAIKGVSGRFRGDFSIKPYYEMVKEYNDLEDREMWEYQLNFSAEQIRRMLMHVWELKQGYFDYFFFKENCSYHLLSLLEIAAPELHLTDQFLAWTIPADTVRVIAQQPDLVKQVTYRPAPSTHIRQQQMLLSSEEKQALTVLLHDPAFAESQVFLALPWTQQALLLDLAVEYLHYQHSKDPQNADLLAAQLHRLLVVATHFYVVFCDSTGPGARITASWAGWWMAAERGVCRGVGACQLP
jgi:hypothetical protein